MGKRPSMSGQAPKRKASKADVGSAAEELPAWAEERSWWPQLQAFLDDVLKGGRPADDYLSERFPTEAARLEFAQLLESSFAAPVPLSSGFRPGVKSFALWQICWSRRWPQRICSCARTASSSPVGACKRTKDKRS